MTIIDEKKREEERERRSTDYNREIFGSYYGQVRFIFSKMKEAAPIGLRIQGKIVIGITKPSDNEPQIILVSESGELNYVPFSEINFSGLIPN